jgi:hypothetical protein
VALGSSVGVQSGSGSAVLDERSSLSGSTGSEAEGSAGIGASANACADSGAGAGDSGAGATTGACSAGAGTLVDVDVGGTAGTVLHDGVGTTVVVVGGTVVVVGAVVVGVAHGSTGAGACRCSASGAVVVVGAAGVVVGCAVAPAVPESITNATVPAVSNDCAAERLRRRGGRRDLDEIVVMDVQSLSSGSPMARSLHPERQTMHPQLES